MPRFAIVCLLLCLASPAASRDVVLSYGYGQFSADEGKDVRMLGIETNPERRARFLGAVWALGFAAEFDDGGEFWVGLGPTGEWRLSNDWFVEASVMPGYFDSGGDGPDLGSDFEIRSLLGIGRHLGEHFALSLALSHKSNADIGETNPGQNSIALRGRWSF